MQRPAREELEEMHKAASQLQRIVTHMADCIDEGTISDEMSKPEVICTLRLLADAVARLATFVDRSWVLHAHYLKASGELHGSRDS